jgi:enamine deaminase RidA (YjgF/YER057c/UK114 family)
MKENLGLQHLTAEPHLPFPRAVRVGDYIYTSSIYPIDDQGKVVSEPAWRGLTGPSAIACQTTQCLKLLERALAEFGSSPELVLKVDVHLASATDFYEFKTA